MGGGDGEGLCSHCLDLGSGDKSDGFKLRSVGNDTGNELDIKWASVS